MTDETPGVTEQIDRGLKRYYGHKNTKYENEEGTSKFIAWVDENGYDSEAIKEEFQQLPDEAAIVDFDEEFPTDKTGDDRLEEIFKILTACFKDPTAFFNSPDLPDEDTQLRMALDNSLQDFGGGGSSFQQSPYQPTSSVATQSYNSNNYGGGGGISGAGSSYNHHQDTSNKQNPMYANSGRSGGGGGGNRRPYNEPDYYDGDDYRGDMDDVYARDDDYNRKRNKRNKGNMDERYYEQQRKQQQQQVQKSKEQQRLEQARKNGYISTDPCYESQLTSSNLQPSSIKDSTLRSQYKEAMDLKNIGDKAFAKENYKKALKNYSQIFIHLGINGTRKLGDFCGNDGAENPLKNDNKIDIGVDKLRMYGHIQMAAIYVKQKKWKKVIEKCSKVECASNLNILFLSSLLLLCLYLFIYTLTNHSS